MIKLRTSSEEARRLYRYIHSDITKPDPDDRIRRTEIPPTGDPQDYIEVGEEKGKIFTLVRTEIMPENASTAYILWKEALDHAQSIPPSELIKHASTFKNIMGFSPQKLHDLSGKRAKGKTE